MRTTEQVQAGLLAISPQGWAWNRDPAGPFGKALLPLAAELARVEASGEAMLAEVDPRAARNLLTDYERALGPDPCMAAPVSEADRRALAYRRWTARGGQSIAYFVALAAAQGIAITITEHPLTLWGTGIWGPTHCAGTPEQFVWTVNLPFQREVRSVWGAARWGAASCGDVVPNGLECPFNQDKPAHTAIVFHYI